MLLMKIDGSGRHVTGWLNGRRQKPVGKLPVALVLFVSKVHKKKANERGAIYEKVLNFN